MVAREKNPNLPPPLSIAPLGQAVMETFSEGVVVFDPYGRMLYANQRARRTLDGLGDGASQRGENTRERLIAFGGRARTLKQGSSCFANGFSMASGSARQISRRRA